MSMRQAGWLFAGPALLVIAVFFALPVLAAAMLSLPSTTCPVGDREWRLRQWRR